MQELTADELTLVSGGRLEVAAPSIRQVNISNVDIEANTRTGFAGAGSTVGSVSEVTVGQTNSVG